MWPGRDIILLIDFYLIYIRIMRFRQCNSTIPKASEGNMIIHGCNVSKEFSQAIGYKSLSLKLTGQNNFGSTNEIIQRQNTRAVGMGNF